MKLPPGTSSGFLRLGANVKGKEYEISQPLVVDLSKATLPTPIGTHTFIVDPTLTRHEIARSQGYTGDACDICGSMRMKVSGHCMVCEECGTTTGCS